jgi:D-alanyl-D-alanine carboxypeptidase
MKLVHALLITLPLSASVAQAPGYSRERARIDSLVNAEVSGTPIAGLAIAVVKGRDTLVMRGYGFADIENEVPATPAHVFRIGSVTKQFTSSAIMQLVEQGRLSLEDTLGALLPNMPASWRKVTLRQLLNHTSGIPSYTSTPRWQPRWRDDVAVDSLLGFVSGDTMNFAAGSQFRYNNTGYVLLGMIVEKTSGQPYARYVEDSFSKPLGLTGTMYCTARPIIKRRAQGYERQGKQLVNAEYLSMTHPHAAGALCSTVRDLIKWNDALHRGVVVKPASLGLMATPVSGAAATARYGFGLGLDTLSGHRRVAHGGGIHGFQSMLAHYPDDGLTVAVLSNSTPAPVGRIATNIARIVLGLPVEAAPPPRPVTPEE